MLKWIMKIHNKIVVNRIKNDYIRRALLVLLIIPSTIIMFVIALVKDIAELATNMPQVFKTVWKKRDRR